MTDTATLSMPTRSPRVSVVIPTYNRARDVERCLQSLLAQTFKSFEVLVCDDGSKDDTAQVIEKFQGLLDLRYDWAENFGGPARPRNAGLRLARGEYVAFLDADDWWSPEKLAESVRALDAGADFVYHDLYWARSTRQRWYWRRSRTRKLTKPAHVDLILKGNAFSNSSVVVRRELMLRVGGFSEDRTLIACEDYDAWVRVAKVTEKMERLPRALGYYWVGGGNITSPSRTLRNLARLRDLYLDREWQSLRVPPPAWYHYGVALAHYDLGAYAEALPHLRMALRGSLPPGSVAKALLIALAAFTRRTFATTRTAAK